MKKPKPQEPRPTTLLNMRQAMADLCVSYATLDRLVKEHRLAIRIGTRIRIDSAHMPFLRGRIAEETAHDKQRVEMYGAANDGIAVKLAALTDAVRCDWHTWTYVAHAESAGLYKIGRTRDLERRWRGLSNFSPVPVEFVALACGEDFEAVLHVRYASGRRHGEWFESWVGEDIMRKFTARPKLGCLRCVFKGRAC